MAGLSGIFRLDADAADTAAARRMAAVLVHRGTHVTLYKEGPLAMAQGTWTPASDRRRTDSSPFATVADARLDNREELLGIFGWNAIPDADVSDADLITEAYARWGETCVERLTGAFAFAVWDERSHSLFCARDRLGVRPFYFTRTREAFVFGSEIKAVCAALGTRPATNETRVADHLLQLSIEPQATFYAGIVRLPAATGLRVTSTGVHERRYWQLQPDGELDYANDRAYADAFYERFEASVRARLRTSRRVGTMLSGGLDSSSITCVTRQLMEATDDNPLDTFSSVYESLPECDERTYIESVVEGGGVRPHYHAPDQHSMLEDLDLMLWHVDEPFFTPNLYQPWHLWRKAEAAGIGVILDGFLGDDVVNHGSLYPTELAAQRAWRPLLHEARSVATTRAAQWRFLRGALAPLMLGPVRSTWDQLRGLSARSATPLLNQDFVRSTMLANRLRDSLSPPPRTVREDHLRQLRSPRLAEALEIANKAAAHFGVEPRFPFTDHRLVEFCVALPASQRYKRGWTRMILRHALRDALPEAIYARRGKANLTSNFVRSLLHVGRDQLDSLIYDRLDVCAPYLNVAAVQEAYREEVTAYERGEPDVERIYFLGLTATLTRWLEMRSTPVMYADASRPAFSVAPTMSTA